MPRMHTSTPASALLERATDEAGARSPDALPDRVREMQERNKDLERRLRSGGSGRQPGELARSALPVDGTQFVSYSAEFDSMKDLQSFARALRAELGDGVIALGLEADEPQLFVTVSDDLVSRGVSAGTLVGHGAPVSTAVAAAAPEMAQARGTRRDRLPSALTAIRESLEQMLREDAPMAATATGNGAA